MKRIAVIFEGNVNQRMGVFNAVVNRVEHLSRIAPYKVDLFMIQVYDGAVMRLLRHSGNTPRTTEVTVGDTTIHMLWHKRSMADALRHRILHRQPSDYLNWCSRMAWHFRGYDLVTAHDRLAAHLAALAGRQLDIPHFITWHGSDIHTAPQRDDMVRKATIDLLKGSTCNFFVSPAIEAQARMLAGDIHSQILPNGVRPDFKRLSDAEREQLRKQYDVGHDEKVVAFVGNLLPVKNIDALPHIFDRIREIYTEHPVQCWVVGDGPLRRRVEGKCRCWGQQDAQSMPSIMNAIDVLVLPSHNEGLPLVVLEAMACGASVVATHVGGIADAIGQENVIEKNDQLVENMAQRVALVLRQGARKTLPARFNWATTATLENDIYSQYLNQQP